jgi:hypothetical protein
MFLLHVCGKIQNFKVMSMEIKPTIVMYISDDLPVQEPDDVAKSQGLVYNLQETK